MSILITPGPPLRAKTLVRHALLGLAFLGVLVAGLALLNSHERSQKAADLARAEATARVQVATLAATADQDLWTAQRHTATAAVAAGVHAQRAQLAARSAERISSAQALLASSDGKADPALRASLQSALDELAGITSTVGSRVEAAIAKVNVAADPVSASAAAWEVAQAGGIL